MTARARHLRIAGQSLNFEPGDDDVSESLLAAVRHLEIADTAPSDATRWTAAETDDVHPDWSPGSIVGRTDDGGAKASRNRPASFELFVPGGGIHQWGVRRAFEDGDIRAHPASIAIAAWLATRDLMVLHAGAVEWNGGAALLVGASGAGKSTSSVACALRGCGYIADDMCVVDVDRPATVHALYGTMKLNPDSADRLQVPVRRHLGTTAVGKAVLLPDAPVRLHPNAPVDAIILLDRGEIGPQPIGRRDAMRSLGPTALMQAVGAGSLQAWLRSMSVLLGQVPAFRLGVTWDLDRVADDVQRVIAGLA